ncbi:hypothetical protein GOBAR_DD34457 [Gossypium barbadense]|nr:hypothetical protein GOBAR_DD34457 [Gossypium barbadense]
MVLGLRTKNRKGNSYQASTNFISKSTNRDGFQNNCLEFYLYEPRKDKVAKGQLLGSAVVNLADYGTIRETIRISTPINLKKSSRNIEQPLLYLNIQPFDKAMLDKLKLATWMMAFPMKGKMTFLGNTGHTK